MENQKKLKTPEVLCWVFFVSQGVSDNTDLMRCHILCNEICFKGEDATVKEIKESSAYKCCICNIPKHLISDAKIQEMINFN